MPNALVTGNSYALKLSEQVTYIVVMQFGLKPLIAPTYLTNIKPLKMSDTVNLGLPNELQLRILAEFVLSAKIPPQHPHTPPFF
jgi:hypothetical protein